METEAAHYASHTGITTNAGALSVKTLVSTDDFLIEENIRTNQIVQNYINSWSFS